MGGRSRPTHSSRSPRLRRPTSETTVSISTPTQTPEPTRTPSRRRRSGPLLWAGGALAAAVLVLGVNGTLSSWTSAVVGNDHNTAGTRAAVALQEEGKDASGAAQTCDTSTTATNTVTCSIDKYTGTTTLAPGSTVTADVTFTNTGTGDAASLTLAPGTCTDTANTQGTGSLCSDGLLTISLACVDGATFTGTPFSDLAATSTAPSDLAAVPTLVHTATIAPDAQVTCRFTVAVDSATPVSQSGTSIDQPLTWTLAS